MGGENVICYRQTDRIRGVRIAEWKPCEVQSERKYAIGGLEMVWVSFRAGKVCNLYRVKWIFNEKGFNSISPWRHRHATPCGCHLTGANFILRQDSDPKHRSKLCKTYLVKKQSSCDAAKFLIAANGRFLRWKDSFEHKMVISSRNRCFCLCSCLHYILIDFDTLFDKKIWVFMENVPFSFGR